MRPVCYQVWSDLQCPVLGLVSFCVVYSLLSSALYSFILAAAAAAPLVCALHLVDFSFIRRPNEYDEL